MALSVQCEGRRLAPASISVHEPPGVPGWARVEAVGGAADRLAIGAKVEIAVKGQEAPAFVGTIARATRIDGPGGVMVRAEADTAVSAGLDPGSLAIYPATRGDAVAALLGERGLTLNNAATGGDRREQFAVLGDALLPAAARLELLAGRLIVPRGEGTLISVDPSHSTGPIELPRKLRHTIEMTDSERPTLALTAPDPARWGERLVHEQPGRASVRTFRLWFPEAATGTELAAAAGALAAVLDAGEFQLTGGPALAAAAPGAWIAPEGYGEKLVTGRFLAWTAREGLSVRLFGGYPWRGLAAPRVHEPLPANVVRVDATAARVEVDLPSHGVRLRAALLTPSASSASVVAAPPKPGDRGLVAFAHGSASHPVYLGAALPPDLLDQALVDSALWVASRGAHGLELGDSLRVELAGSTTFRSTEYDFDFN